MKKMVLLYNFSAERQSGVRRALAPLHIAAAAVPKEQFGCPLGALLGADGFEKNETPAKEAFDDELLIMSGFDSAEMDIFFRAMRKHGVGYVPYKAIVTPVNIHWPADELYRAVRADHEETVRRLQEHQG